MVTSFIETAAVPPVDGPIVSGIAPHAGYVYSGPVAGYTFRAIADNAARFGAPETVVVLGFSHRGGFRGVALMDGDVLSTPLGEIELDGATSAALVTDSDRIFTEYAPHQGEHSAENEVPFVQVALPDARLVMALIGDHSATTRAALVSGLLKVAREKNILVVASTDMLHDPDYDLVSRTDRTTLDQLAAMDEVAISQSWDPGHQVFCGIGPVLSAMAFARASGCSRGTLLHYRNSGDDHPESRGDWVVGYGAAVFAKE